MIVRVRAPFAALLAAVAALATAATASAVPIADTGTPSLPAFTGSAATAHKVSDPTIAEQNPCGGAKQPAKPVKKGDPQPAKKAPPPEEMKPEAPKAEMAEP